MSLHPQSPNQIPLYFDDSGSIQLRKAADCPPSAILINSPYDPDARGGNKRTQTWTGYKVHLSETCDEDAPHLITYVETESATTKDHEVTENLHQNLAEQELLPDKHLVDAGYIDAQLLVDSKNHYEVDLIGPAPRDSQWQSRADHFLNSKFKIQSSKFYTLTSLKNCLIKDTSLVLQNEKNQKYIPLFQASDTVGEFKKHIFRRSRRTKKSRLTVRSFRKSLGK